MFTLIREGGMPMFFVLGFGILSLWSAARFARAADRRHLGLLLGLSLTTLFSTGMGLVANLSAVGHKAPGIVESHPGLPAWTVISQGLGEAMAPGIIGFSFLALSALVAAVGLHRSAERA